MNEQSDNFNFCPRCGALTRDGICQSCGYQYSITDMEQPKNYLQQSYIPEERVSRMTDEDKRKKNLNIAAITAGAIGGVILLICIFLGIFVAIYVTPKIAVYMREQNYQDSLDEYNDYDEYYPDEYDNYEDYAPEEYGTEEGQQEEEVFDIIPFDAEKYLKNDDYFLNRDYRNEWNGNHVNHGRSEFSGKYYENICDSIDYNVSYKIIRKYGEYRDPREALTMRYSYIQLEGDIPDLESLNKEIMDESIDFIRYYYSRYSNQTQMSGDMYVEADSYVTYNDENILSIVLNQKMEAEDEGFSDLHSINIDLAAGEILVKSEILNIDVEFADDYKKRSFEQNYIVQFMEMQSDEVIRDYLMNDEYNIFFYTPLGMEVGYNCYTETTSGWVTVTYKDYKDFLKIK